MIRRSVKGYYYCHYYCASTVQKAADYNTIYDRARYIRVLVSLYRTNRDSRSDLGRIRRKLEYQINELSK